MVFMIMTSALSDRTIDFMNPLTACLGYLLTQSQPMNVRKGIGTYKYTAIDGSIHIEGVGEIEVADRALLCPDEPSTSCGNVQ